MQESCVEGSWHDVAHKKSFSFINSYGKAHIIASPIVQFSQRDSDIFNTRNGAVGEGNKTLALQVYSHASWKETQRSHHAPNISEILQLL